jgi:hypothetical protein
MKAPGDRLPPQEIKRLRNNPKRLKAWTLRELDPPELEPPFILSTNIILNILENRNWPAIARATFPTLTQVRQQYILAAIRTKNDKWLKELVARHPELAEFALHALTRKRKRGREKGDPRPDDEQYDHARGVLPQAPKIIARIRDIWWRKLGFKNRSEPPTAIEIAAEYLGVTETQLRSYLKNRHRRR